MSNALWFAIEVDRRYYGRFLWTLKESLGGKYTTDKIQFISYDLDEFMRRFKTLLEPLWERTAIWEKESDGLPTAADLDAIAEEERVREATK